MTMQKLTASPLLQSLHVATVAGELEVFFKISVNVNIDNQH